MLKELVGEDQDVDVDVDQDVDVDVDHEPVGEDKDVDDVEDDAHSADGHGQVTVDWLVQSLKFVSEISTICEDSSLKKSESEKLPHLDD